MKVINEFLRSQLDSLSEDAKNITISESDVEELNSLFLTSSKDFHKTNHFKIKPQIQRGQIWTIKNEYEDFQGITQKTSQPFIVIINNEVDDIEKEDFVRIFVVSPFVEMANSTDEICNDTSIIGFPFLIELWNDQPILTEILDEYLGYYELKQKFNTETESISEIQGEFRDIEISRAKYINYSVRSLLSFLENKQSQDAGAVISIFNKPEYPKFYIEQSLKEPAYSLAAKSGNNDNQDKYLLFENTNLPFKIFIRKDESGFILSIDTADKMKLLKSTNEEIAGLSNNHKTVFSNLKAGNYILLIQTFEEPIKIRLK